MTQVNQETSEELRADIERTRGRMSQRIDKIQEQLSPENLKQQAQETVSAVVHDSTTALSDYVKANSREMATGLGETIRQNPIPAALIGLGVGWLLIEGFGDKEQSRPYDARYDRQRYYDAADGRNWQDADFSSASYRPNYGGSSSEGVRFASQYASDYERDASANVNRAAYSASASQAQAYPSTEYGRTDYQQSVNRYNNRNDYNEQEQGGVSQVANDVKDKASDIGQQISAGVQQAGHQAQDQARNWRDSAEEQADHLREGAHSFAEQARSQADSLGHQVQDYAGQTREQLAYAGQEVQHYAEQAGAQLQHSLQDNPLIFGGIALGIGALLGLALPATRRENQLMGSTRDQVMDSAKTVLHEAQDRAEHVMAEVQPKLEETAHKVADDLTQAGRSALHDVQETGKSALADVKESGKQAANEVDKTLSHAQQETKSEAQKVADTAKDEAGKVKDQAQNDAREAQQRTGVA